MAIRASSAKQISALIEDLSGADAIARDAAVARLTVIGARAVERLIALAASSASSTARVAAFRTLEGIADDRALPIALGALTDADQAITLAAAALAHAFVLGPKGALALDRLTQTALDAGRPDPLRVAALRALRDLDPATIAPLLKSLSTDRSEMVRTAVADIPLARSGAPADPRDVLNRASRGELLTDPQVLRHAIAQAGSTAALPSLLRVLERVREHEQNEALVRRADWTRVRAAAHLALAQRGSRLAVYDLRESLERSTAPLPVEFLTALAIIGDASCVEAIAGAYARANDRWWRDHLADAFRALVTREKLTRRHAAVKRAEKKWKTATDALWPA